MLWNRTKTITLLSAAEICIAERKRIRGRYYIMHLEEEICLSKDASMAVYRNMLLFS